MLPNMVLQVIMSYPVGMIIFKREILPFEYCEERTASAVTVCLNGSGSVMVCRVPAGRF